MSKALFTFEHKQSKDSISEQTLDDICLVFGPDDRQSCETLDVGDTHEIGNFLIKRDK